MDYLDELRQKAAIACIQGLLSNPTLVDRLIVEDSLAISADVDFDPWQNRIADLAIECADSLVRRLVE